MKKVIPLRSITLQPESPKGDPLKRPYPYHIEVPTGRVDRQDFWKGAPLSLVCLLAVPTKQPSPQEIADAVPLSAFLRHPKLALDRYPVFAHADGEWYTYQERIASIILNAA